MRCDISDTKWSTLKMHFVWGSWIPIPFGHCDEHSFQCFHHECFCLSLDHYSVMSSRLTVLGLHHWKCQPMINRNIVIHQVKRPSQAAWELIEFYLSFRCRLEGLLSVADEGRGRPQSSRRDGEQWQYVGRRWQPIQDQPVVAGVYLLNIVTLISCLFETEGKNIWCLCTESVGIW